MLAFAAAAVWAMSFLTLYGFGWNDYAVEVAPAYSALAAGHLVGFLQLAPAYGGSLELRAPFALLPGLWHGGETAVYQAVSLPCLIAAALFGVWLVNRMRAIGHNRLACATALGLCVANPVTLYALQDGHPEELLGAVLCVVAVLAAQRERSLLAGALLGLAIVNKEWGLLAIGPVLVALPSWPRRGRALGLAGAIAVVFYAPLLLSHWLGGPPSTSLDTAASGGAIFQPWQLWWFLGSHGALVHGSFGVAKPGYRTPPGWIESISHPLIVALAVPVSALALRRRGTDAMLLLALLLALRCALDTWDFVYYPLPFLFALLVWEATNRRRPPLLALAASVAVWLVFVVAPERLSPDAQALLFALVALPTLAALIVGVYSPGAPRLRSGFGVRARRSSSAASAPMSLL